MRGLASRRLLPALAGVLVALGVALPAAGHELRASEQTADVRANGKVTVVGKEFEFIPSAIRVKKGQHVTIVFRNEGKLSHNLTIPKLGLHTETIQTGAQDTIRFTARKDGTYPFWCTVPGHKEAGMVGKLTVK